MTNQSYDALPAIKSLAFQNIPVAVTGSYKGVLFEEKVAPLRITPASVIFRAPKSQICATLQTPVVLHSQVLSESVRAHIQYLKDGELCLSNFTYTGLRWRNRIEQRVEPDAPVTATLTVEGKRYRANLLNLSLHGAGLMVFLGDSTASELAPRARVEVNFRLSEQSEFNVLGNVASVHFLGYSLAQAGLSLQPTPIQESWLEKYITRRKIEILEELEHRVTEEYRAQQAE